MLFRKTPANIRRLLVVEDEPLIAFDNEYFLEQEGYEVVATVDNAVDAINQLEAEEVDAVLLDVNLAGELTGLDVARKAREREVPVLFLTGNVPAEAADFALAALAKPYGHRDLAAALQLMDQLVAGRVPTSIPPAVRVFD